MTVPEPMPDSAEESFLVVEGDPLDWGARCRDLAAVALEADWLGSQAPEATATLGLPAPGGDAPVRLVVLRSGGREVPLKVQARVSIEARSRAHVCPLPTRVLGPRTEAFDGIVLTEGRRPLLIVNPNALAAIQGSGLPSKDAP